MGNKCIFSPPALLVFTPALVYWWVGVGGLIDFREKSGDGWDPGSSMYLNTFDQT